MNESTSTRTPESEAEQSPHHLEQQRRENRQAMVDLGALAYGRRIDGLAGLADARAAYDEAADTRWQEAEAEAKKSGSDPGDDPRARAKVAGRIVLKRGQGKLIWMQLRDSTTAPASALEEGDGHSQMLAGLAPDLQIAVSKAAVDEDSFAIVKKLDLGDIVVVEGSLGKTRRGEVTLWASAIELASKSVAPPPEKWSGLQDIELRYRNRYVDLYANPESMRTAMLRSEMIASMRDFLRGRGFKEVETPMLQSQAGGAAARPFVTHMNALDIDLYMRIAPELYLKRLLVGGMPRVFEINRNFRNEGLDKQHNPEFTMLELYQAFGDVESVMENSESLIRHAATAVAAQTGSDPGAMPFGDLRVDYASDFVRVTYAELFERELGYAVDDHDRALADAEQRGLRTKGPKGEALDPLFVVNELFEEVAEPALDPQRPTWIMQYPSALSPLTRPSRENPSVADRSDLFIGHMEIGPHYTELNDPDIQAAKFREQLAGIDDEESTFRNFDEDFVNALKVGMPPAGGMGMGIDRVAMLLLNQPTIRDVILFPMMKPLATE